MSITKELDKFKKDIEKYPHNFEEMEKQKENKNLWLLLKVFLGIVAFWIIVGVVGVDMKSLCLKNSGNIGNNKVEPLNNKEYGTKSGFHREMNLVDVNTVTANDEFEKLNMGQNQKSSGKGTNTEIPVNSDVDPQKDLKEIFSVSPVIIFSSSEKSKKQTELENIFLLELSIVPEPKVVDLLKHPRHSQIIDYLTSYTTHEQSLTNGGTTNLDYNRDLETEDDSIPRVFLGGVPIGDYKEITRKFNDNELLVYLRDIGQGLISVS